LKGSCLVRAEKNVLSIQLPRRMLRNELMDSEIEVLSEFKRNNRWISENYHNLKKQYNNQWVAVLNNAVIDHDPDLKKLVKRLKAERLKVYNQIAVEYVTSEELDFILEQKESLTDSSF
jgi:hypothetical protein